MPDVDHAQEGLQQSLRDLASTGEGTGYVPVAGCRARARLGGRWIGRGAQKDQDGDCCQVIRHSTRV